MILSGKAIQQLIKHRDLSVNPKAIIKEASIKIHLSDKFGKDRKTFKHKKENILKPKEFILALSAEKIKLSNDYAGLYDGYIGLSSQGIISHLGSMLIDPGFEGQITLEIYNASNKSILLKKGMRVGHLMILRLAKN